MDWSQNDAETLDRKLWFITENDSESVMLTLEMMHFGLE